jgi:hypothetical protein
MTLFYLKKPCFLLYLKKSKKDSANKKSCFFSKKSFPILSLNLELLENKHPTDFAVMRDKSVQEEKFNVLDIKNSESISQFYFS